MAIKKHSINLLAGERVIITSDNELLTLTNKRVRFAEKAAGRSSLVSITIDSVASCGLVTRSYPFLIAAGVIAFAVGIFIQEENVRIIMCLSGLVLAISYLATRSAVLQISSNGNSEITVPARGMARDQIVEFIDAIENEKIYFLNRSGTAVSDK